MAQNETSEPNKKCPHCGEVKPLSQFSYNHSRGCPTSYCKICSTRSSQRAEAAKRARNPKLSWAQKAIRSARQRAHCDLTIEDILEVAGDVCPILGVPLRYPTPDDVYTPHKIYPNSPSLDRIVPERVYVRGNIAVISNRANTIKNDGTATEHRMVANWLDQKLHQSS